MTAKRNKKRSYPIKTNRKIIIAIVGMPGSGKTEASNYLRDAKKIPFVSFGKTVNKIVDRRRLEHTESVHKKIRRNMRMRYGKAAFARISEDAIGTELRKNPMVVIDGLRSWEEYEFLQRVFLNARVLIIALYASKEIRYKRIQKRSERAKLYGIERDKGELIDTNMGSTIAFADFLIVNNLTKHNLFETLNKIIKTISHV